MPHIEFNDVWEMYRLKFIIDGKVSWENFWALRGASFSIGQAETLGIIGENGSGKSTVLKLICGMLKPDRGEVKAQGSVSGLLELGAGFQPELTGSENIYLSASLFGLNQGQAKALFSQIVDFADIGKFIYAPVKCYSQGMFVRLAFAVAIHMNPDILLIDDTLAVGDEYFQRKCIKKIFELKEQGKIIVVVTHDMNILRKLCHRTILLKEGRVIKDDACDTVISLYSHTIGAQETVGIIEKKPLNLIFNNGRIFLNWNDVPLTSGAGGYVAYAIGDKWHTSLQADWKVKKEGECALTAVGNSYQGGITQIWKLECNDSQEIKWEVTLEADEPCQFQEAYVQILLVDEYARWFTAWEKGIFPVIEEKDAQWQLVNQGNALARCIGVEAQHSETGNIPSLAFEQLDSSPISHHQILNSDCLNPARVLQYRIPALQVGSSHGDKRMFYFAGKIHFGITSIPPYLEKLQDQFIVKSGPLKWTFRDGKGILSCGATELTTYNHFETSVMVDKKRYFSHSAHWEVKKKDDAALYMKAGWAELPLTQTWEIKKVDAVSFIWNVFLQAHRDVEVEEQWASAMCRPEYRHWFNDYGSGAFPEGFIDEIDIIKKCIPRGVVGVQGPDKSLPGVALRFSSNLENFAKILNSDFHSRARILRIYKMPSGQKELLRKGEHPCFSTEIIVGDDMHRPVHSLARIVESGMLKLAFESGKVRLYWDNTELTKGLGVYTSMRSQGRWHDSATSALWEVESCDEGFMQAKGRWLHLPVSQVWEIRLKDQRTFELQVCLELTQEVEIDRMQTNIMLSERYAQWIADTRTGSFPVFKGDIDDDWDAVWPNTGSNHRASQSIAAAGSSGAGVALPAVTLFPLEMDNRWFLHIVNSDLYHRGRVLQYSCKESVVLPAGKYPYFKGTITVAP